MIAVYSDIEIGAKSNGKRRIFDLMKKFSKGPIKKAFDDSELFAKITALTYPEIAAFLSKYVSASTTIAYNNYFAKMGVSKTTIALAGNLFIKKKAPLITKNPDTKEISFIPHTPLQTFLTTIGVQSGYVLFSINNICTNLGNINDLIMCSTALTEDEEVSFTIKRNGVEKEYGAKAILPKEIIPGYQFTKTTKSALKKA